LFVLAYAIRLIYLFQIESMPVFYNLPGDPRTYDDWAQRIVAGDWIGDRIFYQAPLYPYFLAILEKLLGHNLWLVRLVQIALSAGVASFLYLAGKAFFSKQAGIAAGLIWCFYAPAIFFGALIDKTVTDGFLVAALLVALGLALHRPRSAIWIASGAILGLLGLSRENALIWTPLLPVWILVHFRHETILRRFGWCALFVAGIALVLVPVGLRNFSVGGQFTLTTAQLGPNFFIGNNAGADGTYGSIRRITGEKQLEQPEATALAEQAAGRTLTPAEVSTYWLKQAGNYIASAPADWLRLTWRKWLLVWNVREIEDSDDFYLYQRWSWLLSLLACVANFGLLAAIAAIGVLLTSKEWRNLWLLYLMILSLALSVALFFVFGRYRFPLTPLLSLFAGAAVLQLNALLKSREAKPLFAAAIVFVLSLGFVYWPVAGRRTPSAPGYTYLANAYAAEDRIDDAIASAHEALKIDPEYGMAHYNLGNFYARKGRLDDAMQEYTQAIKAYPRFIDPRGNLANILTMKRELGSAVREYREALTLSPRESRLHLGLGNALALQGEGDEAINEFKLALKYNPEIPAAHAALAQLLAQAGRRNEAIPHYEEALRLLKSQQNPAGQQRSP
jgi:tetratricopeptide (TPR) repeat protein